MLACKDSTFQQHLTLVNEANISEFSLHLGMIGEVYDGTDVKWAYTGGLGMNRILDARFSDEDAEDRISELLEMFRLKGVKPHWITGPSTTPSDITERLERRGYHKIEWSGMAADLNDLPDSIAMPEGLEVREITDPSLIQPFMNVLCTGFGWPTVIHEPLCNLFTTLGVQNVIPWRHYIGYLYGVPASTCTIYEGSGALGVYLVSVMPGARRQGVGLATTWCALHDAKNMDHRVAVLQASPMGKGVYEKIGFEEHCKMALFAPNSPVCD
ncbi:MAG TPA: GNAT family N-acetyltransferase [Armatimonadota bacterium]|jgi:hypothetical protein